MTTTTYTVVQVQPTVYNDQVAGIVNGVLVRINLQPYNELYEIRIPRMDSNLVDSKAQDIIVERDKLSSPK